jgi:glutamate synthase (NADPH/NADH) small chain
MPKVPGAELRGFLPAVEYLTAATRHVLDPACTVPADMDAAGKDVVIVGNGDTATDCLATALRQGARSVAQLYYRARPAETRTAREPWPLNPKVLKTDYGQIEAIETFGHDPREFLVNLQGASDDGTGAVGGVTVARVQWTGEGRSQRMQVVEGSAEERPCQMVLIATGYEGPEPTLIDALGLKTTARHTVATAPEGYETSARAVFAAGDMRRGQSLVVWAIHEGLGAARQCHAFLEER